MYCPSLACRLPLAVLLLWATPLTALSISPDEIQDLFASLDTNQDGQLSKYDIDPDHARLFARLLRTSDLDRDDQLSAAEFASGLQPRRLDKPLPEKQGSKLPGGNALLLLLVRMDANSDLTLQADEISEELRGLFNQIEAKLGGKQDGIITRREITRVAPRLSQAALQFTKKNNMDVELEIALLSEKKWALVQRMDGPSRPTEMLSSPKQAQEIFNNLDANSDGQITSEEVPPPFADRFEQVLFRSDKNRDGKLSKKELLAFSRRMAAYEKQRPPQAEIDRRLEGLFKQFDRNNDQLLSRKEAPEKLAARFDRIDADSNGTLDRQELSRAVGLLNQMRKPEGNRPKKKRSRKKQ